jgi:hypothetical protein
VVGRRVRRAAPPTADPISVQHASTAGPSPLLYLNSKKIVNVEKTQRLPPAALRLALGLSEDWQPMVFSLLRRRNITDD